MATQPPHNPHEKIEKNIGLMAVLIAVVVSFGGLTVKVMETTFYLGRETLLPSGTAKMAGWRKRLFIVMTRNAQSATTFFNLPPNRVVEMGAQIQL